MPLAFGENLFGRRDVRETPAGTSTSTSSTSIIAPIGSIMAWLKSFTNTPQTLPTGWMECDGSAISDADSVYDGQNAPDLNGGEFIRGAATSGGTGGSDTMAHTHTLTSNVTVGNHTALTLSNHNAIAIDNHTALAMNNHTNLVIANESTHEHDFADTDLISISGTTNAGDDDVDQAPSSPENINLSKDQHTHTFSDTDTCNISGTTTNGDAHTHAFTTNIDAHVWGQNIDAHVVGTNIDAHSFSQNISVHSVTNNQVTSDAASNTENRPKYYDVVWIFRFK